MKDLEIKDYTLPIGGYGVVSSAEQAEELFANEGIFGHIALERIMFSSGECVAWTCRNSKTAVMAQVFQDAVASIDKLVVPTQPIAPGELLCNDNECFYLTCLDADGKMCIQALAVFPDEETVRKASVLLGINVVNVSLIQLYNVETSEYLTAGWLVKRVNGAVPYSLFFVDLRDRVTYKDYDFNQAKCRVVNPGNIFSANGKWYELLTDSVDRLYLAKSSMQIYRQRVHRKRSM